MYFMLDLVQINSDGDGFFYLVVKVKYSVIIQKVIEFLCDKKLNVLVLNKEGKFFKDYFNFKNDRRLQVCVMICVEIFQKQLIIFFYFFIFGY